MSELFPSQRHRTEGFDAFEKLKSSQRHRSTSSAGAWGLTKHRQEAAECNPSRLALKVSHLLIDTRYLRQKESKKSKYLAEDFGKWNKLKVIERLKSQTRSFLHPFLSSTIQKTFEEKDFKSWNAKAFETCVSDLYRNWGFARSYAVVSESVSHLSRSQPEKYADKTSKARPQEMLCLACQPNRPKWGTIRPWFCLGKTRESIWGIRWT